MGLKQFRHEKRKNGLRQNIDEAIYRVEGLKQSLEEVFLLYKSGCEEADQEPEIEVFKKALSETEKLENNFYTLLGIDDLDDFEKKLEKEFWFKPDEISIQHDGVYNIHAYEAIYEGGDGITYVSDKNVFDGWHADPRDPYDRKPVLVELKLDKDGQPVFRDGGPVCVLLVEGREKLQKFLPIFKELVDEEDGASLQAALQSVEQIGEELAAACDYYEDLLLALSQKQEIEGEPVEKDEEVDDIEKIENYVQLYGELKGQI